ncbi:hypothetical protein AMTRI_Chr09g16730 [Amborella trichopoda]
MLCLAFYINPSPPIYFFFFEFLCGSCHEDKFLACLLYLLCYEKVSLLLGIIISTCNIRISCWVHILPNLWYSHEILFYLDSWVSSHLAKCVGVFTEYDQEDISMDLVPYYGLTW